MTKKRNRISLVAMLLIAISFMAIRFTHPPHNIISYDYYGSYLYLPALFIYNDIGLENIEVFDSLNAQYGNTPMLYQLSPGPDGKRIIRFFAGMSYMFAPGFLAGQFIALVTDYPADGFSLPYQRALLVSGMFISLLGLYFSRKILLRFFSDGVTALTLFFLLVGSNLIFFYTFGNDAPHLYLFALHSVFLWLCINWHDRPSLKKALLVGITGGLILVSRPSEMLIFIVPLGLGIYNWQTLKEKVLLIFRNYKHWLPAALIMLLIVLPQFLYWKYSTGNYFYSPYDDPASTLKLSEPQFINTLFGFRKGWFIYAPMMFFAIVGLVFMFRKYPGYALPIAVYLLLNTYLIASFTSLISFGWRAFIQSYAVLVIPMGYMVHLILNQKLLRKIALLSFFTLLTVLNLFKSWQLVIGVIDGSRMTKEYYFATFFKLWTSHEDSKLLLIDRPHTLIEILENEWDYNRRELIYIGFGNPEPGFEQYYDSLNFYEGRHSLRLDNANPYSRNYTTTFEELTDHYFAWVRASAMVLATNQASMEHLRIVVQFTHKGKIYKYRSAQLSEERFNAVPGEWTAFRIDYLTPEVVSKSDRMKVYLWYTGQEPVYINNLKVEVFDR